MATSYTPNLDLAKPLVDGPETENTWGFDLNANFDKIDAAIGDQVSDIELREVVEDTVANLIKAGANVSIVYDDAGNRLTIHSIAPGGSTGPQNVFDTIHDARLATIPPELKVITLAGYNRPGDAGPAMPCRRTAAQVTIHKGVFRTADRYTDAGIVDATNGGWWEYVGGHHGIAPEWFGAKADYYINDPERDSTTTINPTPTDNYQPVMDASNYLVVWVNAPIEPGRLYAWSTGPAIRLGHGAYYFSETLRFGISVALIGNEVGGGQYHDNAGTRLFFAPGKRAFQFLSSASSQNSGASNAGTLLRGLYIRAVSAVPDIDGILMQGGAYIEHCSVSGFGGHGIAIIADSTPPGSTNANCYYLNHVHCYNNGGDGVYCAGGDANAGLAVGCNFMGNGGWGFRDNSFLGNFWLGNHIDGNAAGAYYMAGSNNRGGAFANYTEGNQPPAYIGSNCVTMGGYNAAFFSALSEGFIYADGGISQHRVDYRGPAVADTKLQLNIKEQPNTIVGMRVDGNTFPHALTYEHGQGVFAWRWGDTSDVPLWAYTITTEQRVRAYGRTEAIRSANIAFPKGIFLGGDPPGLDSPRYFGVVDHYIAQFIYGGGFTMHPGPYAKGDTLINGGTDPGISGNHWGEFCVAAGAHCPYAWVSGTDYVAPDFYQRGGSYVKNGAGKIYRCVIDPGAVPSTVQPTHASGDVTGADGYGWRWLADSEPVFKRFGPLMGDYVVTVNDPIFNVWQTWNNAAVAFVGNRTNIVDTASHTDSMLEEWCVGGTRKASIRKDGVFLSNGVPVVMLHELDELRDTINELRARIEVLEAA